MNFYYEPTAYNFNPRQGPKELKLKFLIKTGIMKRQSVPIGKDLQHKRYSTACRNSYLSYHNCLESNYFDRGICRPFEKQVIACEHREGLYMSNQAILTRLRTGLQVCKTRRQQINRKHEERYNMKKNKPEPEKLAAPQPNQGLEFDSNEDALQMTEFLKSEKQASQATKNTEIDD